MIVYSSFVYKSPKLEASKMTCIRAWLNTVRYVHTTEHYIGVKRNKLFIHASLEGTRGIMLTKKTNLKVMYCMKNRTFSKWKNHRDGKQIGGGRGVKDGSRGAP